ncbi:DNA-binding protein [Synechococcus sp. MU1643]|uniref:DNA-binding protein n=1 Tax=Synechococcus sp. MU1643 TaxID=2508349 RepID=UPI001CF88CF6|nr:DNA-binding protein [Synechococcus sp. MU1643]MCB4427420.1 DNA-binding protein [Synechococcus sp. MU1643]
MDPAQQWVHEREAAELLALKHGTLRTMRRDRRLLPGDHYIFATGTAGGPVVYNITAIRESMAQRTKDLVTAEAKRRAASKKVKQDSIETFSDAQHVRAGS